jgi:MFS family permease
MFKNNRSLIVISVIAVVNALGYGIIIPILYSYSRKFGLSDFQNGLLFALFSICQFAATPIIGRLSDKYGRKPLLVISIAGTAASFLLMAFAPSAIWLFVARALDGITAGNIPVASAVISDTTEPKDRAKGFGLIGASFGFGFIFGPAISAATIGFGISTPFLIAAAVSIVAVLMTVVILPETNKNLGVMSHEKLFDFKKLFNSIFDEKIGETLLLSLLYSFSFGLFIYAYQPFAVRILHFTPTEISINFVMFGIIGLIAQVALIPILVKRLGEQLGLMVSLVLVFFAFFGLGFAYWPMLFIFASILLSLGNSFVSPMIQTLLSREADETLQGSIQGLNASYVSIGMIIGPIVGGAVASLYVPAPFLAGAVVVLVCLWLGKKISHKLKLRD